MGNGGKHLLPAEMRKLTAVDWNWMLETNQCFIEMLSPLTSEHQAWLDSGTAYCIVAEIAGQLAGFALALRKGGRYKSENYLWFEHRYRDFLYIDRVVIAQTFQRRGLGTMLYRNIMDYAAEGGLDCLVCEFDIEPLNVPSYRFHAEQGFGEVGRRMLGKSNKEVSMQLLAL